MGGEGGVEILKIPVKPRLPSYARRWILLDVLGCVVGVLGGLGAVLFRLMISVNHMLFFDVILPHISLNFGGTNLGVILLPALGGLIIGPIITRLAPETKGHGVPEVLEAATLRGGRIRKRVAFLKVIVSSITIGSGGSAGREGPIAQIGATLGSIMGQLFKLGPRDMKLLVVCGLAAGIAGTFNAPLGGALFGLEILYRGIGLFNAMPVILSSVIGATVASVFLGRKPAFNPEGVTTWTPQELPLYLLLGVVFGILSILWVKVFYAVENFFEKLNASPQLKPAIGGLIVGLIGVFYARYGIMGVGYEGIDLVLAGKLTLTLLILLGFLKILATSFTIGSGGSGGIFAPSLYIGSMFGGALGILFHTMFPSIVTQPATYALAGMAALFAGAAQAPINVIIMIPEMSGTFTLIPPIMASSATSFFIAWLILRGSSIYTIKLERRGIRLRMSRSFILDSIKVEEVMNRNVVTLSPEMPVPALETLFEEYHHTGYPVVEDGKLVGIVTISDVQKVPPEKREKLKIRDIASRRLVVTYPDETVHQALDKMYVKDVGRLPVVDRRDPRKILGIISKHDILKAFELAERREAEEAEGV
ncbi:MAG: chloride channel protein [Candidatus Wolframiiraptor sp. EX4484-121]|nr:MAG: chloride channel protein [Candidatus Wolframiiraptor sp. EX4484-121]